MTTTTFDAFSDAQARLDEGDEQPGDRELVDAYDVEVLQPAQEAFQARLDAIAAEAVSLPGEVHSAALPPVIYLRLLRKRPLPVAPNTAFVWDAEVSS